MNNVIGLINDTKRVNDLKEIIYGRSMATVPFGGRYRMVDFTLSNMINSGIQNVGILVQRNYRSLMGHIRSPKEWDLDRKRDGLFVLPPDYERHPFGVSRGDLDVIYSNLDYIARSKQDHVLVSGVNMICNIDYREALNFHRKNNNDITIIYKQIDEEIEEFSECTFISMDEKGRITDMEVGPNKIPGNKVSMEMYIISKRLLVDLTYSCVSRGEYDFVKGAVIKNIDKLNIYAYPYSGYLANICSIKSFYKHNMDLLNIDIWEEIFFKEGSIYTKVKDQAPAKYMAGSRVKNSLVANGCVIEGQVENSVLFRTVRIKSGAKVLNSIIMQNCTIGEDTVLENVILDKDVVITKGKVLASHMDYPMVIEKKTVI